MTRRHPPPDPAGIGVSRSGYVPRHGAIAAVESEGARAGAEAFALGGNAADAAIAAAFAQSVVDPMRCSIGGGAHVLYYDAATRRGVTIDAGGVAPGGATSTMFTLEAQWENAYVVTDRLNRWGYRAQVVPGFVAGLQRLFDEFGSMRVSWRQLIAPAIRLAGEGFAVHPHLYAAWQPESAPSNESVLSGDGYTALSYTEESRRVFLHDDGSVYRIGEVLRQPDLARTLESIADEGADAFYRGEIAERIGEDFAANDGLLSLQDLHAFAPVVEAPVECAFGHYRVLTESAPSIGPTILQILRILDGWDLGELGWNTPEYLDKLANAMYLALCERDEFAGDPLFVDVALERLLSSDHARELRELAGARHRHISQEVAFEGARETTHVAAIDTAGNACGVTHSVGLGTGIVTPGLGFMHNCHMVNFDPRPGTPNEIAPGKRGTQGGAPVIVLAGDEPVLSMGSPAGAYKITALVQVFLNVAVFGMTISEAVAADRIHVRTVPDAVVVERRFDPRAAVALAQCGHDIVLDDYGARVAAVSRDPASGELVAASDPRGDRGAAMV
jgi:gamma-glutamyltranspeptidase / glutathione hydrolase